MEAARAIIHDQYLPMHLWAEAARTAVYVQNRTPQRLLENKNPEEVFSSKKPEVIHLIIYFPGYKKINISRDVTFDEDTTYNKSTKRLAEEPEEAEVEAPRIHDTTMNEEAQQEY